jgi:hypothetical protein
MWLWYLELYVAMVIAFALGALLALALVRLLVRRKADNPYEAEPDPAAGTTSGAST